MHSNYLTLILLTIGLVQSADTDFESTTTTTVTPTVTSTVTVGYEEEIYETDYVYTLDGVLTTYTVFGSTVFLLGGSTASATSDPNPIVTGTTTKVDATSVGTSSPTITQSTSNESTDISQSQSTVTSSPGLSIESSAGNLVTSSIAASGSDSSHSAQTSIEIPISVPQGTYSTSEYTTLTTLENGSTAILEMVVMITDSCKP